MFASLTPTEQGYLFTGLAVLGVALVARFVYEAILLFSRSRRGDTLTAIVAALDDTQPAYLVAQEDIPESKLGARRREILAEGRILLSGPINGGAHYRVVYTMPAH